MVYFKLTKELLEVIYDSRLEGLVACQRYCDRQIVSFEDIDKVLQKLKKEYKDAKDRLEKLQEKKRRLEQPLKGDDDLVSRHREFIELVTIPDSENNSEERTKEVLSSLEKYEKMEIRDLTQNTQIIFQEEHICNDNLKIKGEDEGFLKPEEIIE